MATHELERFLAQGEPRWRRLEALLDEVEAGSPRRLGPAGLRELVGLYRRACADLTRLRSLTADPVVVGRLNGLAGRGYRFLYRGRSPELWGPEAGRGPGLGSRLGSGLGGALRRFFAREIPAAFQGQVTAVLAATAIFLGGALLGMGAVFAAPELAPELIPEMFFTESPRERVETIEREDERIARLDDAALFSASLYTHNIRVSLLAFSLGALTLVGGGWILFTNGLLLGAVSASYLVDGVGLFLVAWVGPHGALELPAIIFAGAAGFVVGRALYFPGRWSRGESLRRVFPTAWRMLAAVAVALVIAGFIEGSFSQMSAKTVPYALKVAVAAVLFLGFQLYLFRSGAGRRPKVRGPAAEAVTAEGVS